MKESMNSSSFLNKPWESRVDGVISSGGDVGVPLAFSSLLCGTRELACPQAAICSTSRSSNEERLVEKVSCHLWTRGHLAGGWCSHKKEVGLRTRPWSTLVYVPWVLEKNVYSVVVRWSDLLILIRSLLIDVFDVWVLLYPCWVFFFLKKLSVMSFWFFYDIWFLIET